MAGIMSKLEINFKNQIIFSVVLFCVIYVLRMQDFDAIMALKELCVYLLIGGVLSSVCKSNLPKQYLKKYEQKFIYRKKTVKDAHRMIIMMFSLFRAVILLMEIIVIIGIVLNIPKFIEGRGVSNLLYQLGLMAYMLIFFRNKFGKGIYYVKGLSINNEYLE